MKEMLDNFKNNWKTSVTGVILLVVTLLVGFGVFTEDQAAGVKEQSGVLIEAIGSIIGAVSALILMFKAKD